MKILLKYNLFILFLVLTSCTTISFNEENLFYPVKEFKIDTQFNFERHFFTTADSVRLEAWSLSLKEAKMNIIYFQGNAYNLRYKIPFFNKIGKTLQSNIFAINYRGYGFSEGKPTIDGIAKDGRAALQYFYSVKNFKKELPTYIIGYSIGSYVTLKNINTIDNINGIILISPFTSAQEMIDYLKNQSIPFYKRPFVRIITDKNIRKLDNLTLIKRVQIPILFIHGKEDNFVPPAMSEKLFSICPSKHKEILLIPGANHQTILSEDNLLEQVLNGISAFLLKQK